MNRMYELAKEVYAKYGVDTDAAIAKCKEIPVALHCCQGEEFRGGDGILSKGVENTIRNISRLGSIGMKETDKEIIQIMTDC